LGISAFYHDSAACLVVDGEIVAAAQEERFTRMKHDHRFPRRAAMYCLGESGLSLDQLDFVAFYDKPLLKFERLLETYIDYAPRGFTSFVKAMPIWMKEKLWMPDVIRTELAMASGAESPKEAKKLAKGYRWKMLFGEHHESHAASAFYPSPFEESAILTMDGVGEWATSSIGVGSEAEIKMLKEIRFPDSLGSYTAPSPITPGSRSTAESTKSWGSPPTGSRSTST
jgi:carbamoyltransferase